MSTIGLTHELERHVVARILESQARPHPAGALRRAIAQAWRAFVAARLDMANTYIKSRETRMI